MATSGRLKQGAPRRLISAGLALGLAAWLLVAAPPGGQQALRAADLVWDYSPYRIRLWLGLEDSAPLTPALRAELLEGLQLRAETVVGAPWDLTVEPGPPPVGFQIARRLETLSAESLPELDPAIDKVLLLAVRTGPQGYQLVARDYDHRCRTMSQPVSATTACRGDLVNESLRVVLRAFAPLAQVDSVEGRTAQLRLRGGRLPLRDPSVNLAGETGLFQPIVRTNARDGTLERIRPVEWTVLEVTGAEGAELTTKIHSGVRGALGDRRRGRIERLALGVPPVEGSTRLKLEAPGEPPQPMAGYTVLGYTSDSRTTEPVGTTDLRGEIEIRPSVSYLRLLLIMNGSQPLAKLPIVPGLVAQLTATVPDDQRRLEVEGFVAGLQESMVDLVVRREVLVALAQKQIEAGNVEGAQKLIDQLRELPTRQQFAFRVQQEEQRTAGDAPRVKRRVERLFSDTRTLLSQYLDPRPVDQVEASFVRLKNSAGQKPPEGGQPPEDAEGSPPGAEASEAPETASSAPPEADSATAPAAGSAEGESSVTGSTAAAAGSAS